MFASIIKVFEKIQKTLIILFLIGIIISTFLQVFTRYVLNHPFMWTEEMARFFGVWLVMLAAGVLLKNNEHCGLDLIPKKYQPYRRILTDVLALFFSLWLISSAFDHVSVSLGRISPTTSMPMWIYYASMPAGLINIAFWGLYSLGRELALLIKPSKSNPALK